MLAEEPAADTPDPVAMVDQMLRRALRVGPASGTDPIDSDTWSAAPPVASDFWDCAPIGGAPRWLARLQRARSAGRTRIVASMLLVAALAGGWIVTSELGNGRAKLAAAAATVAPESRRAPAAESPPPTPDQPPATRTLRDLVPPGATCGYGPASANQAHCSVGGVQVAYGLLGAADLRARYLAAIGSLSPPAAGEPACANGAEDERSWSRPTAPRRAVGRYACRIEQGRAAMWWTVDDRGVLAHATSSGADLASLFAWWTSHAER